MRPRICTTLVVLAFVLLPVMAAAAPAPAAPSLEVFLSSLPAPETGGAAPAGVPEPLRMDGSCLATYQSCQAACSGNSACELQCQCDYFECRGFDAPTYCL